MTKCGCCPSPGPHLTLVLSASSTPDDSAAAPKAPWGINIIKKNKKAAPRAFGVRLEECQPATENQVGPSILQSKEGDRGTEGQSCTGLEPALHLVLQTQLGKQPREGAAELRQSPSP